MIMFELLTLERPYKDLEKSYLISKAIVDGDLPILPNLPSEYDEIVEIYKQCLSFNPENRPRARELITNFKLLYKKETKK